MMKETKNKVYAKRLYFYLIFELKIVELLSFSKTVFFVLLALRFQMLSVRLVNNDIILATLCEVPDFIIYFGLTKFQFGFCISCNIPKQLYLVQ